MYPNSPSCCTKDSQLHVHQTTVYICCPIGLTWSQPGRAKYCYNKTAAALIPGTLLATVVAGLKSLEAKVDQLSLETANLAANQKPKGNIFPLQLHVHQPLTQVKDQNSKPVVR